MVTTMCSPSIEPQVIVDLTKDMIFNLCVVADLNTSSIPKISDVLDMIVLTMEWLI